MDGNENLQVLNNAGKAEEKAANKSKGAQVAETVTVAAVAAGATVGVIELVKVIARKFKKNKQQTTVVNNDEINDN